MRRDLASSIVEQFQTMECQGRASLDILDSISRYKTEMDSIKANILKFDDNRVSFHYYHALRSCYQIVNKILGRLENSKKDHGNSQIASDAIAVFSDIDKMIDMVDVAHITKKDTVGIINATFDLNKLARQHQLLPDLEENIRSMNQEFINNGLISLIKKI